MASLADRLTSSPAADPPADGGGPISFYRGCPVARYQRWRFLPRLIRVDDLDLREPVFSFVEAADLAATAAILARLRLALDRAARRRLSACPVCSAIPQEGLRRAHEAERWILDVQERRLCHSADVPPA